MDRDFKIPLFTKNKAECRFCVTDKFTFNFEHVHKWWRIYFDFCVVLSNDIFLNQRQRKPLEKQWQQNRSCNCSLAGASVSLNERPLQKNNNQGENFFSKIWKKKEKPKTDKTPNQPTNKKKIPTTTKKYNQQKTNREKFSPAPLDESGHGVRNAEEKEERIAVNLSELLYLFH